MERERYRLTSRTPSDDLGLHAMSLRAAAPAEWERFMACFSAYTDFVTAAVTEADQNSILNMQGRAQALRHVRRMFAECHTPKPQPKPGALDVPA